MDAAFEAIGTSHYRRLAVAIDRCKSGDELAKSTEQCMRSGKQTGFRAGMFIYPVRLGDLGNLEALAR
jgi:hypothetical protein